MDRQMTLRATGLFVAFLLAAGVTRSETLSSASFRISNSVFGGGGTTNGSPGTSANYRVYGTTIGQPSPIGYEVGSSAVESGGFWSVVLGLDGDSFPSVADNCPSLFNRDQADTDADNVGDVCDNCTQLSNPRWPAGYLAANPWATLTGGQRDDDGDGFGNKCDADFALPGFGLGYVGDEDLAEIQPSIGKSTAADTCGTSGSRPCAIFDLDEAGTSIDGADMTRFQALQNMLNGPTCGACPLRCEAGPQGHCP